MPSSEPGKALRIAMVIDTFGDVRNGAVISTQRFTGMLRKDGHRVTIVSTGEAEVDKVVLKTFYPPFAEGIMRRMNFIFAWPDHRKIREAIREADVVHIQFPFYLGFTTAKIAKNQHKPIVASFHVQAEQLLHNVGVKNRWLIKLVYRIFIRFLYDKADIVICPSRFAETEIKRYGLTTPTAVISNGITDDYKVFDFPRKYPDQFVLLTVGRNAAEKRQDWLIRAVAASRYKNNIKVIIVGNGPLREHLVRTGETLLDGNVDFEYLPPHEVVRLYNTSDLYVHCAEAEVECMTALEAMACGLPLLIADAPLSAARQFALDERHLFPNVADLTRRIEYWYENDEALKQAKTQYLHLAEQYRIETSYEKLKAVYLALAVP
ncbi:MAG TPA: glycosyltransferase [Saprospiraceae bacterium]|nr:glycosyltransferase [Saprospiraceae bacterium]